MKQAFQKDDAFLLDVGTALKNNRQRLWWLGQSGFLWVRGGSAVVLDPYLSDSLTRKYAGTDKPHTPITERVVSPDALGKALAGRLDFVSSSHNHTDHLDAETLRPLLETNPNAKLLIPEANRDFVLERLGGGFAERLVAMDAGKRCEVSRATIHAVPAAHNTVERDSQGRCKYLGYVVIREQTAIYQSGDTLWYEALAPSVAPFKVQIALLPINGDLPERRVAGNLDGPEAARLAKAIGAGAVIPCHYDMFEFNTASTEPFAAECQRIGQACQILRPGEGIDLT